MKKLKKALKTIFIIAVICFSVVTIGSICFYKATTQGISLDTDKLQVLSPSNSLKIYNSSLDEIKPSTVSYVKLSKLSSNTKNAFLCAEDKRFYKHKGLDYIRIGGALVSNIKSASFSEGASTISQQLVKNTQLSNEKTIKRKLKEIKLTKELENKYTKDEILELYLNNIYFGNGCYGIENASKHYFGKPANQLSLAESALLAGSINAPSFYDIESNLERAINRRNLILNLMQKYNKINGDELQQALNEAPNLNLKDISSNLSLYNLTIKKACKILNLTENQLRSSNYKIYTSIDDKLLSLANNTLKSYPVTNAASTTIILDNKSHSILAIGGNVKNFEQEFQPGSLIKPILVYAPAIEKNIISPATKILDNKINISGYSPSNYDKKFHGYISAKTALAKSYNIPAVKILNELGVENAKEFAKNLGIEFENSDNHLALALGAFEKGITPKSICDAYSSFANSGSFAESSIITKITLGSKIIYNKPQEEKQAYSDSTAFLINDMLKESVKTGTAKKLSSLNFPLCSKTGTVGKSNSNKNTLAFNIAYTSNHLILTLISGDNLPSNINGGSYPTNINKDILKSIYKNYTPSDFEKPNSVKLVNLDEKNYTNNELVASTTDSKIKEYFKNENSPKLEQNFLELNAINSPNHKPILCFTVNKNYDFYLIRKQNDEEKIILSSTQNNENFIKFCDKTAKNNEIYTYFVKFCGKLKNDELFTNEIKLKAY